MKYRNIFGYIFFVILLALTLFEYITPSLMFMLIVPYIAINTWLNSLDEKYIEQNKNRLGLLAFILAIVSFSTFYGQIQTSQKTDDAMKYCYKFSKDSNLCDELYGILESIE